MIFTGILSLFYAVIYGFKKVKQGSPIFFLLWVLATTSTPAMAQWQVVASAPNTNITALCSAEGRLYAATATHLYISSDAGTTWQKSAPYPQKDDDVMDILVYNGVVYLGMVIGGINISLDGGGSWKVHNTGLPGGITSISMLAQRGNMLYAATNGAGVFVKPLEDVNAPWAPFNTNMFWGNIFSITNVNGVLLAGGGGNSTLQRRESNNPSWTEVPFDEFNGEINALLAAFPDKDVMLGAGMQGLYRSTDQGLTWSHFNPGTGLLSSANFTSWQGQTIVLLSKPNGSFLRTTTDQGLHWEPMSASFPAGSIGFDIVEHAGQLYCARSNGLWVLKPSVPVHTPGDGICQIEPSYPNPAIGGKMYIPFELKQSAAVSLRLYDAQGRMISQFYWEGLAAGHHVPSIDLEGWHNGAYWYSLAVNGRLLTRAFHIQ